MSTVTLSSLLNRIISRVLRVCIVSFFTSQVFGVVHDQASKQTSDYAYVTQYNMSKKKYCFDEATALRYAYNAGLILAADLLGGVTVGDAWNSWDDEGPSIKMFLKFAAGCASVSVLFDCVAKNCPHCLLVSEADNPDANADPEEITYVHQAARICYNLGKLVSVVRLGRTIYDVFAEDKDVGSKCLVLAGAPIGMAALLKDLYNSYQEHKNNSGLYSKCIVS